MSAAETNSFIGKGRFRLQRVLGFGGFGIVYQVFDEKNDSTVALKALKGVEASALYRFKQEFRRFADFRHPNLVRLYELFAEGDQWFFTMEMVEGTDILHYVRGSSEAIPVSLPVTVDLGTLPRNTQIDTASDDQPGAVRTLSQPPAQFQIARLRDTFQQLVTGVSFLHQSGLLHRDLKPSNVLVTKDGRVVLLDFGLAEQTGNADTTAEADHSIVGTPSYMAPEQAAGLTVSDASDWYSMGVMLFEALTGGPPFYGPILQMLRNKQTLEPPAPHSFVRDVPEDLDRLCTSLLRREPADRPAVAQILDLLSGQAPAKDSETTSTTSVPFDDFVGRERHLSELWAALADAHTSPVTVHVHGQSGMGKTALIQRFLRHVKTREAKAVVLAGRCYERESVPYKALDSLVDDLCNYLKQLPQVEVERLIPRDVMALCRLFPVLQTVEAFAHARGRRVDLADSQEVRRRGFAALRELFTRLADQRPVILFIDDIQWGDFDSGILLLELLSPPDGPPLLLVLAYRDQDAPHNQLIQMMRPAGQTRSRLEVRELLVSELEVSEAESLARKLLGQQELAYEERVSSLVRESAGSPFFIGELVRYAGWKNAEIRSGAEDVSLESVLIARAARLSHPALLLLEAAAVAGQPLPLEVGRKVAHLSTAEQYPVLDELRSERLLRSQDSSEGLLIETYHDRIRETIVKNIAPEDLTAYHRSLATELESFCDTDAETLALHLEAAGDREKAAQYAIRAAFRAAETLAFDRAVRLYRWALQLCLPGQMETAKVQTGLGNALSNAGHGPEAAEAYLAAAEAYAGADALDLKRKAAEQLLICGHIDEGIGVLRQVLQSVGINMSDSQRRALFSLLRQRTYLALRGLRYRERTAGEVPPDLLMRVDTCWSGAIGFSLVNTIRGADFQARHLLLALQAGEPYRLARALGMEIGYASQPGGHTKPRTDLLTRKALALAERVANPHALGVVMTNMGAAAFLQGDYQKGLEQCEHAEAILRERCRGATWELDTAQTFLLDSLYWTGAWDQLFSRMPIFAKEAHDRGDLLFASFQRRLHVMYLALDDPIQARDETRRRTWSQCGFHVQHYMDLITQTEIDLYAGDNMQAWERVRDQWTALQQSLLTRIQFIRVETWHLRARAALAVGVEKLGKNDPGADRYLTIADDAARRLEREDPTWAKALAALVRCGTSAGRGQAAIALEQACLAERACEKSHMAHYAAAARLCRGYLLRSGDGDRLMDAARVWMNRQQVRDLKRMMAMLAPGCHG